MTLREALINKGYDQEGIDQTISNMIEELESGRDPEDILFDEGLEADYVFDLLDEAL